MTEAITIFAMRAMNEIIETRKVKTNAIMRRESMAIPRGLPASGLESEYTVFSVTDDLVCI
jgi:hypothetical protein